MPECEGARNCTFNTKKDGSNVSSQEIVVAKFTDLNEEVRRRKGGK